MAEITAAMVKELRERTGAGMMACKKALSEANGDIEQAIDNMRKAGQANAAKRAAKVAAEGVITIAANADSKTAVMIEVNSQTDFVARDASFKKFADEITQSALAEQLDDPQALLALQNAEGETFEAARQALVAKIGENIQVRRIALMHSSGVVGHYLHGDRIGVLVALDKDEIDLARDIAMHIAAMKPEAISPEDVSQEVIEREKAIYLAQAETSGKPQDIVEKMVVGRINKFLKEVSLVDQPFVKNPDETVGALLKAKQAQVLAFVRFEVGDGIEKEEQDFAAEVMAQVKGE